MSAASELPSVAGNVLPFDRFHNPETGFDFEYGTIQTDRGDLYALVYHTEDTTNGNSDGLVEGHSQAFWLLNSLGSYSQRFISGPFDALADHLGFRHFPGSGQGWETPGVTTIPSVDYLNDAMSAIFEGRGEARPITFVGEEEDDGHVSHKKFIEQLAEGKVVVATPLASLKYFEHDYSSHVAGYCRMDTDTFAAIRARAQQLVDQGELAVYENSFSSAVMDSEPYRFATAVDHLSYLLIRADVELSWSDLRDINRHLKEILKGSDLAVDDSRASQIQEGLAGHQSWLKKRAEELRTAAGSDQASTVEVNVGDLVFDGHQKLRGLGVVIELEPELQVAPVLEATGREKGLKLGLPGTIMQPVVDVVASLPLDEVARSMPMARAYGFEELLDVLHEAAARGPIRHAKLNDSELQV